MWLYLYPMVVPEFHNTSLFQVFWLSVSCLKPQVIGWLRHHQAMPGTCRCSGFHLFITSSWFSRMINHFHSRDWWSCLAHRFPGRDWWSCSARISRLSLTFGDVFIGLALFWLSRVCSVYDMVCFMYKMSCFRLEDISASLFCVQRRVVTGKLACNNSEQIRVTSRILITEINSQCLRVKFWKAKSRAEKASNLKADMNELKHKMRQVKNGKCCVVS